MKKIYIRPSLAKASVTLQAIAAGNMSVTVK